MFYGKVYVALRYYSRQLRGAEMRYSATELEGLAVYQTLLHFGHYLYGAKFNVLTDHKPLEALNGGTLTNTRLQAWTLKLQNYDYTIKYRPGRENGAADGLSRQARDDSTDAATEDGAELTVGGYGDKPHKMESKGKQKAKDAREGEARKKEET